MSLPTEQHFIFDDNGVVYWQSPDDSVRVSNQSEVRDALNKRHNGMYHGVLYPLQCYVTLTQGGETNFFPSGIQNHTYPVALVTFSKPEPDDIEEDVHVPLKPVKQFKIKICNCEKQNSQKPEEKETQEELYNCLINIYHLHGQNNTSRNKILSKFTITRKEK